MTPLIALNELYPCLKLKSPLPNWKFILVVLLAVIILIGICWGKAKAGEIYTQWYPEKLWMGIVAEDTSGNYQTYLAIASVVRNRLKKNEWHGLVALKRQDLLDFITENYLYVLKTKGIDIENLAKQAIFEVFVEGKDYANGATNYEHTGHYLVPSWAKKMQLVKVMYSNTKREIRFWK